MASNRRGESERPGLPTPPRTDLLADPHRPEGRRGRAVDATGRNGQSIAAAARFTEPVRFGRLLLAGPHPVALGEGYAAFRHADPAFAAFLKTRMDLSVAALQRDVLGRFGTTQIIHGVRAPGWLIVNGADASSEATLGLSAYLQATGDLRTDRAARTGRPNRRTPRTNRERALQPIPLDADMRHPNITRGRPVSGRASIPRTSPAATRNKSCRS